MRQIKLFTEAADPVLDAVLLHMHLKVLEISGRLFLNDLDEKWLYLTDFSLSYHIFYSLRPKLNCCIDNDYAEVRGPAQQMVAYDSTNIVGMDVIRAKSEAELLENLFNVRRCCVPCYGAHAIVDCPAYGKSRHQIMLEMEMADWRA